MRLSTDQTRALRLLDEAERRDDARGSAGEQCRPDKWGLKPRPNPSARWLGRTLLVRRTCFLRLLAGALVSGSLSSRCRAHDQPIVKP
jgi:hypothetical protein